MESVYTLNLDNWLNVTNVFSTWLELHSVSTMIGETKYNIMLACGQ